MGSGDVSKYNLRFTGSLKCVENEIDVSKEFSNPTKIYNNFAVIII